MSVEQINWSAKGSLALGFAALAVLVVRLGAWSVKATIAGAVITSGVVEQVIGAEAQRAALNRQRDLIGEELANEGILLAKGLSHSSTVRWLQREAARLEGEEAGLKATIAERRGRIAEIEIEVLRLHAGRRERAIATLRDLRYREIELREAQNSLRERLQRMDVRAPSSGIVYGKQIHALRAIVRGAWNDNVYNTAGCALVIATKIPAIHIDQVHIGQVASLHFSAFDMRTTPVILGKITKISPDVFIDEMIGGPYYAAEIIPGDTEMCKLEGLKVLPGMPVQVFLKTADRTPLEYLIKPLADYFEKAFRGD